MFGPKVHELRWCSSGVACDGRSSMNRFVDTLVECDKTAKSGTESERGIQLYDTGKQRTEACCPLLRNRLRMQDA